MHQEERSVTTTGRGTVDISSEVAAVVDRARIQEGLCHVFIAHTSASLMVTENADPAVRRDLERFMSDLVLDGDPRFEHNAEGPDDMAAHVRSLLTETSVTVPIRDASLALGTWQGIYLWEHRARGRRRRFIVTACGPT